MQVGKVWITSHTGKMAGIESISTWCGDNPHCIVRAKDLNSICANCYAMRMKYRHCLIDRLKENTKALTTEILKRDELPYINGEFFRFESFGDLNNDTQLINYLNICNKNPHCTFALWTKNFWIVDQVLELYEKPENLLIVASSTKKNKEIQNPPEWADSVFTVYDKEYLKSHKIEINCGDKQCLQCRKCYTKQNKVTRIREKIK